MPIVRQAAKKSLTKNKAQLRSDTFRIAFNLGCMKKSVTESELLKPLKKSLNANILMMP